MSGVVRQALHSGNPSPQHDTHALARPHHCRISSGSIADLGQVCSTAGPHLAQQRALQPSLDDARRLDVVVYRQRHLGLAKGRRVEMVVEGVFVKALGRGPTASALKEQNV